MVWEIILQIPHWSSKVSSKIYAFEDPAATGLNLLLQQSMVTKKNPSQLRGVWYLMCILTISKSLEPTKATTLPICQSQGGRRGIMTTAPRSSQHLSYTQKGLKKIYIPVSALLPSWNLGGFSALSPGHIRVWGWGVFIFFHIFAYLRHTIYALNLALFQMKLLLHHNFLIFFIYKNPSPGLHVGKYLSEWEARESFLWG